MKRDGLYVPDARPLNRAPFLSRKTLTQLLSLTIHASQHRSIQVALIKRGFTASHDRRYDAWKRFDAAHCTDSIGMLTGYRTDLERQLGRGCQRVPPHVHGR